MSSRTFNYYERIDMGLFKGRKKNINTNKSTEQKAPTEIELLQQRLKEVPDDELMVFLSTLDENQLAYALYSGDRYAQSSFFYRILNGNFKENLEKVPEKLALKMISRYLDFYCTRYFEATNSKRLYVEEKIEIHSGELKAIWDDTKHEEVKLMLAVILCLYYSDVEEYLISTGHETIRREAYYGLDKWNHEMTGNKKDMRNV